MTPETPVIVDVRSGYRAITLNRPDKLNAFNEAMHQALRRAIDEAEADESCRALLITGAGRGFCAGQDLSDRAVAPGGAPVDLGESIENNYRPLVLALRSLPLPVVCAVNGVAAHPVRLTKVEDAVRGKARTEETATMAGELAVQGAQPLRHNGYKVPLMRNLVRRAIRGVPRTAQTT